MRPWMEKGREGMGKLILPAAMLLAPMAMEAGDGCTKYRCMGCGELWYERNAIFAEKGYCFQTRRAIRVFGPRCYPPYGRLNRWERDRVAEIRYWERVKRCR
jgi:hypothetical protein